MPSFPTLIVKDLEVSANFYQNALRIQTYLYHAGRAESLRLSIALGEIRRFADHKITG
jgi:hypothetical protein